MPTIRFINTFDPVVPLFLEVLPRLEKIGWQTIVMMSAGAYRSASNTDGDFFQRRTQDEYLWLPKFLRKYKRWCAIFYMVIAPFKLLFRPKDVHIFLTQPPLFFILGSAISRILKVPYIIHIMDLYPDLFVETGLIKNDSFLYKIFEKAALKSLLKSHGIIVLGRCMRNRLLDQGVPDYKIAVVPNWASTHLIPISQNKNEFLDAHKLHGKFVVMYSGNMGISHDFYSILQVAKQLQNIPEIIFVFIGRGNKRNIIKNYISQKSCNLLLFDYQEAHMLPHSLSAASVHFVSLKKGFEGMLVPSKFYGILASGRPLIYEGDDYSEIALAIKEANCGLVTSPQDIKGLKAAIMKYYQDESQCNRDGKNARIAYEALYSAEIGGKRYFETLRRMIE